MTPRQRAKPMTYCLGKLRRAHYKQRQLTLQNTRSDGMCAPSATRTRDLLLRSNPGPDAVATSENAGHGRLL
jgi:hypothetical protein